MKQLLRRTGPVHVVVALLALLALALVVGGAMVH